MDFKDFMKRYQKENSPVGDLAADMAIDPDFPKGIETRRRLIGYLNANLACSGALEAAKEAWKRYQSWALVSGYRINNGRDAERMRKIHADSTQWLVDFLRKRKTQV